QFKRTQAPYCISGKVTADKKGTHRRNNNSLVYRDLIFLDYDELEASADFPRIVSEALSDYSYIIYPTIKHTAEKPRYRLVVKPSGNMDEATYKEVIREIANKIGLPFDTASLTWSQLQGLPVTTGDPDNYQRYVNRGKDYPVPKARQTTSNKQVTTNYSPRPSGQRSITMRVIDTLLNGFGDEGGRNIALTRFVGLLLNRWVDCDIETAYELTQIA
ncbi:primase alpha helix C-terminal domain-containing protein, partial [Streptococcus suis]